MADFAVSTAFTAQDRVSKAFGRMDKSAGRFGDRASRAFRDASRSASRFESVTKGILAAGVIQRTLTGIGAGVRGVATEFVGFDQAITSASAKFKGLDLTTRRGQQTLLELKKTARDVGAATQFSAAQAGGGLDFLAMSGRNATQSMALLPGVVDLATVANVDLARATDIATDSLGAFGLMTQDSIQLQKNFTRQNDVMALTMSRTNTSIEDMFEAVKKGAPQFTASGQSLETFNALIGIMANNSLKGSDAGTSLRNVMLSLAKATPEAQAMLDALGVTTQDARGNFRDVVDILADLEKGLEGAGTAQRSMALATIFGRRTVTGINILLQEGTQSIRKFRGELLDAGGASKKMADIMRQSLQNRLLSLKSAAIELGFKFFEAFEVRGGNAIDALTNAIREFDIRPVINAVEFMIEVTRILFAILEPFKPLMPFLIGAWVAYGAALKILAIAQAAAGFISLVSAITKASGAMGILNAVMIANPVGAIIFGITVLITLIVLLIKHWDVISLKVKTFFDDFKVGLKIIDQMLGNFLRGPLTAISRAFNFIGIGPDPDKSQAQAPQVTAPNAAEVEARAQQVGFAGRLTVAGAPPGSKLEGETTGAPDFDLDLLGQN